MKSLFVSLFSVSAVLVMAQDIQHNHLSPDAARSNKIKSAKISIIFLADKDTLKGDTGVVEVQHYDMTGFLTNSVYACTLDKSNYRSTTYYTYYDDGTIKTEVRKELGEVVDSTYWYDRDHYYNVSIEPGLKEIRATEGDSIFKEIRITENDSVEVRHKFRKREIPDKYAGECNGGDFASHAIAHNATLNIDTVTYLNLTGETRLQLAIHYDTRGNMTWIQYFSYGDTKARGFYAKFNNRYNMSDLIPLGPKGKCNYWITKSYNEKGLITGKRTYSNKKHYTPVKVVYTYEYY